MDSEKAYPPQQQGYPPQQQGYPPQQQGYPPQQQGYPPQQQGYPPQGAPPPAYSQQGDAQYNPNAPTQTVIVRQTQSTQPNDYLAFAIFVTICCCLPLGIVAIVQATNVRSRFTAGDVSGAEEASRSAKCWSIAGLVTGIVLYVIGVIIIIIYVVFVVSVVSAATSSFGDFDINNSY